MVASEIGDLYVILRAVTEPFKAGLKSAAAEGEAATTRIGGAFQKLSGVGVVAGGAAAAIGAVSVKWASDFETQMTRLYTAAGLSQGQLDAVHMTSKQLDDAVLKLGNSVGFTGTQMAEALYHPISAGLDLKSALDVVKYSAEEARISGASLDDTTYSLSSVMKAFNMDARDAGPTMAQLNAIVGEGDMRFQDFNESIKNWAPTAAQMGISVQSMGSGLAYLTDRGNSAEVAATRMTMGLSMMTTPAGKATKLLEGMGLASSDVKASSEAMTEVLKKSGITQNQLAADLQKPDGLYVALGHLKDGLKQAGVSGSEADSVLAKIFGGGRSDKAIMSLMQNLDGLKTKYDAIGNDSSMDHFQSAFEKTQQTFQAKLKDTEASLVNLGIKLGTLLLPYVERFLGWVQKGVGWLAQHKGAVEVLAGALATTLVAAIIAVGSTMASLMGPEMLIVGGIMALGGALVYAYNHFKTFRDIVNGVGSFLAGAFKGSMQLASDVVHGFTRVWDASLKAIRPLVQWFDDNVLKWVRARVSELIKWWDRNSQSIHEVWSAVWKLVETAVRVWWDGFMKPTLSIIQSVWKVVWGAIKDDFQLTWDLIKGIVTTAIHWVENSISLGLDLITGKWGRVWGDLKRLVGDALKDVVDTIGSVAADFGTLLWDAGKNLIKGLIGGIKAATGGLSSAVGDVAKTVRDFWPFSPAKRGPLSGSGSMDIAGRNIGTMLADGMHSSVGTVTRASSRLAGAAALAAGGPANGTLPGFAAAGAAGGAPTYVVNVTVQGSVLSERDLRDTLERQMYQLGMRGSTTWQPYARR